MKTSDEIFRDEWEKNWSNSGYSFSRQLKRIFQFTWNHQQKKIDKLIECLEFYAQNYQSSCDDSGCVQIAPNIRTRLSGGKRARQCLKEMGE